jgi:hypothetical protein
MLADLSNSIEIVRRNKSSSKAVSSCRSGLQDIVGGGDRHSYSMHNSENEAMWKLSRKSVFKRWDKVKLMR